MSRAALITRSRQTFLFTIRPASFWKLIGLAVRFDQTSAPLLKADLHCATPHSASIGPTDWRLALPSGHRWILAERPAFGLVGLKEIDDHTSNGPSVSRVAFIPPALPKLRASPPT